MGVSKNRGTPKSSILIGFSNIDRPFWDTPIFGNTHISNLSLFFSYDIFQKKVSPFRQVSQPLRTPFLT